MSEPSLGEDSWRLYRTFWEEIVRRTREPARHVSYVTFFFVAILGFGALGVWIELYALIFPDAASAEVALHGGRSAAALRTAILTFFPALAGTATLQLVWAEKRKHMRAAAIFALAIILVLDLCLSPLRISDCAALAGGTIASIAALWIWWFANSNDPSFLDTTAVSAATGGDDVTGSLEGDLGDFKV